MMRTRSRSLDYVTTIPLPFRRIPLVRFVHQWMAEKPRLVDALRLTAYYNCRSQEDHAGFLRFPKQVLEIDLAVGTDAVLAACDESVRYKIRRAPREGVTSDLETERDAFAAFYDAFAESKGISPLDRGHFNAYWRAATVTKAMHEGAPLAMHAYMVDLKASRATLMYSCSLYRNAEDSKQRNFLGRASLFLYWDDMRRFAEQGIRWFDFGYFSNTAWINQVNEFKKGFPCEEKPASTYIALPLWIFRRITQPRMPF